MPCEHGKETGILGGTTTREGANVEAVTADSCGFAPVSGVGDVHDVSANIIRKPAARALTRTGYVRETRP
jgi:hypothetical protein